MAGIYAADGSYNVTIVSGGTEVSTDGGSFGIYAPDGSYRVTIVAVGPDGEGTIVQDGEALAAVLGSGGGSSIVGGTLDLSTIPGSIVARLPASSGIVTNGSVYQIRNSAGADPHTATAQITADGTVTSFNAPASVALVDNGDQIIITDATNLPAAEQFATAVVSAGVPTKWPLVNTAKVLKSGVAYPVSGGSGVAPGSAVSITPTIVNGVITSFVLA